MLRKPRPAPSAPIPLHRAAIPEGRVGWIAGFDTQRGLLVDFEGNVAGALSARSVVPFDGATGREAAAARRQVLLVFEGGDPNLPIVVGFLQPSPGAQLLAAVLEAPGSRDARVDGKRVILEGADEVVLRCGDASITLQKDGAVVVRGRRISSTARGTHRIRGGSVQIN